MHAKCGSMMKCTLLHFPLGAFPLYPWLTPLSLVFTIPHTWISLFGNDFWWDKTWHVDLMVHTRESCLSFITGWYIHSHPQTLYSSSRSKVHISKYISWWEWAVTNINHIMFAWQSGRQFGCIHYWGHMKGTTWLALCQTSLLSLLFRRYPFKVSPAAAKQQVNVETDMDMYSIYIDMYIQERKSKYMC